MIDFDNVTMGIRSDLQLQLRRLLNSEIIKGKVAVQRAYADWRRYPQYIVPLSEASIDLIFAPAFGSNKKNATDIRLAIDALELVFTRPEIGTFILLSGDSDFSSLVLKLKEYGKYVIGVGLRESSSDLLIQNCDEYYSYTEVTGLTREGDDEGARRDPWELAVEAVAQMKRENDVMRSDRLKQVMQTLDPNFDEKDAGYNRFSKFVVEAGQRGLLSIAKMENGQYAIDVGDNANVPPDEEEDLRKGGPGGEQRSSRPRRRRGGGRRKSEDAAAELTLSAAFDLLRKVLAEADAPADGVDAEIVLAAMVEAHGDDDDPLFERRRFQRMLRQAHDANVIELAKVDGAYRLKPGSAASDAEEETEADDDVEEKSTDAEAASSKRARTRKSSRGRSRAARKKPEDSADTSAAPAESTKAAAPAESAKAATTAEPAVSEAKPKGQDAAAPQSRSGDQRKRNPRFRRGTRGGAAPRKEATGGDPLPGKVAQGEAGSKPAASAPAQPSPKPDGNNANRNVGGRSGSHGRGRGGRRSPDTAERSEQRAAPQEQPREAAAPKADSPPPAPKEQQQTPPAPSPQPSLFDGGSAGPADDDSLFRRMSAALQRVMRGPDGE